MNRITRQIFTIIAIAMCGPAIAQLPPTQQYKPVPMKPQDTLLPVITAREPDYDVSKDPKNDRVVFKGIFAYRDMIDEPSFSWVPTGMDEYHPNPAAMKYLKQHIADYRILIAIGTWCGDSKDLVPKLYKVLNGLNIAYEDIMMIGMDRDKTTLTKEGKKLSKKYKITLLPTFILIDKDGNEAGRIEESVSKSVEEDMVEIMKGKK